MSYPSKLKVLLSAGKGVGITANLVDDGGNSNLPDGTKVTFKLSQKVTNQLQVLKSTDSGVTWIPETVTFDNVANTITFGTAPATTDLIMVSNLSANQPAIPVSTPKPIEVVDRDLIASNHHSVYAYNGLTYASSGKIATGSSVESKGVDDVLQDVSKNIFTTPKHTALTLDNQSIVASKALLTQTSNATQVFTQELGYDSTAGDFGDNNQFNQLTSGTLTDLNGHTVQTKVLLKPSSIKLG